MIRLFNRYWSLPAFLSLGVEGPLLFLSVYVGTWVRLVIMGNGHHPPKSILTLEGLIFAGVALVGMAGA